MGVFTTFKGWFGSRQARMNLHPGSARTSAAPAPTRPPAKPVAIDLHSEPDEDPDESLEGFELRGLDTAGERRPARGRLELISELHRNYQEVLGIVRKVDAHLDEQSRRSERMGEIAELAPTAFEHLGVSRQRQEQILRSLEALSEAELAREGGAERRQAAQIERLDELRGLMVESSQAERELIGSLIEFRDVMGGMSHATERLSAAVERMEERERERGERFLEAMEKTRSWMVTLSVIGGVCAVVAVSLAIAALG